MKVTGIATIAAVTACSNNGCQCPSNWSKATYSSDVVCYRRFDRATYEVAKNTCIEYNATFPRINGEIDMTDADELNTSKFWIQAEWKGLSGSKKWKDWNNKKLVQKSIDWHKEEGNEEPTKGDVYAYFKDGDIYGSDELAEKKFVCVYSIKEACAATENTDNAK